MPETDLNPVDPFLGAELVELFFSSPHIPFSEEDFSISWFREKQRRTASTNVLLFAIYSLAAAVSPDEVVRAMSSSFHERAIRKIEEAIESRSSILELVTAAMFLGRSKYVNGRYSDSQGLLSISTSLSIACKLHQIPTSNFADITATDDWPMIGPPNDQWDLDERIKVFWSVWVLERGISFCHAGHVNELDDLSVTTPLMRSSEERDLILASGVPLDFRLSDISGVQTRVIPGSPLSLLYCSIHLTHRAHRVRKGLIIPGATQSAITSGCLAFQANPSEYSAIMSAVAHLLLLVRERYNLDWTGGGWQNPEGYYISASLLAAKALLHPAQSYFSFDRVTCLATCFDLCSVACSWMNQSRCSGPQDPLWKEKAGSWAGATSRYNTKVWLHAYNELRHCRQLEGDPLVYQRCDTALKQMYHCLCRVGDVGKGLESPMG